MNLSIAPLAEEGMHLGHGAERRRCCPSRTDRTITVRAETTAISVTVKRVFRLRVYLMPRIRRTAENCLSNAVTRRVLLGQQIEPDEDVKTAAWTAIDRRLSPWSLQRRLIGLFRMVLATRVKRGLALVSTSSVRRHSARLIESGTDGNALLLIYYRVHPIK